MDWTNKEKEKVMCLSSTWEEEHLMFLCFPLMMECFKLKQRLEILIWEAKISIIVWWITVQLSFTRNIRLTLNLMLGLWGDWELNVKKPREFYQVQHKLPSKLILLPNLRTFLYLLLELNLNSFAFPYSKKQFLQCRRCWKILECLRIKFKRWC
jgi:hypothetical protein